MTTLQLTIAKQDSRNNSRLLFRTLLLALAGCTLFLIIVLKARTAQDFHSEPLLLFYTIFITSFELSRLVGAIFYRSSLESVESASGAIVGTFEPTISFVIPCKNEEGAIEKTITKCFEADYPADKVEVIIINDGSTDRTIDVLQRLKKVYRKLTVVDWKENRGKRHAMATGFKLASGEIIIQLDSDSYIDPETVRHLINPFRNPEIGAVCAHADPENADKNLMTRMQAAYYFMSFRILKAAESTFMSVFCCSGCSSAYRKSIVLPILDTWLEESFMGLPVTWGDDRSLTNWVLKLGHKTIYTDKAKAYTICPETIRVFLKQQVRWKKGWFVNSIFASRFVLKRSPFVAITYFFPLILVTLATPFMATAALVYYPLIGKTSPLFYVGGVFLVASIITIYYRFVAPENKYWIYVFMWSAINTVLLSFILFYALLRLDDRKWGTR